MKHQKNKYLLYAILISFLTVGCVDSLNDPYPGFITTEKSGVGLEDYIESPTDLSISEFDETHVFGLWWKDNSDNEDGFELWRKNNSNSDFELVITLPKNSTAFNDTLHDVENIYSYKVRAVNVKAQSEYSNEVSTSQASGLQAPSGLIGELNEARNSIELNWLDNSISELGFIIEKKMITEIEFIEVNRVGPNTITWIDSSDNLQPGLTVSYRVRAYDSVDKSNYSNIFSITL